MDDIFTDENNSRVDFLESPADITPEAKAFSMKGKKGDFLGGSNAVTDIRGQNTEGEKMSDLPISRTITKEEFDALKQRKQQEALTFTPFLVRGKPNEVNPYTVRLTARNGEVYVIATFPRDVVSTLTPEQRLKFQIISEDGRKLAFPGREAIQGDNEYASVKEDYPYCIDGHDRRWFQEPERNAQSMTPQEFAQLLHDTPGEGIIFYTGAGISRGGEAPVWDMGTFNKQLHLEGTSHPEDPEDVMKTFLPAFVKHPEEIVQKFREFNSQLYVDVSTPAHDAISDIIDAKPGSVIITENVDLKHEAEGSRHEAIHLDSKPETFDLVKKRADATKVLVTVGLSADDRAVIAYLKEKNPELKIVSFALPPRHEKDIPNFLQGDYIVFGDCQQILPEVAESIQTKNNEQNLPSPDSDTEAIKKQKEAEIQAQMQYEREQAERDRQGIEAARQSIKNIPGATMEIVKEYHAPAGRDVIKVNTYTPKSEPSTKESV